MHFSVTVSAPASEAYERMSNAITCLKSQVLSDSRDLLSLPWIFRVVENGAAPPKGAHIPRSSAPTDSSSSGFGRGVSSPPPPKRRVIAPPCREREARPTRNESFAPPVRCNPDPDQLIHYFRVDFQFLSFFDSSARAIHGKSEEWQVALSRVTMSTSQDMADLDVLPHLTRGLPRRLVRRITVMLAVVVEIQWGPELDEVLLLLLVTIMEVRGPKLLLKPQAHTTQNPKVKRKPASVDFPLNWAKLKHVNNFFPLIRSKLMVGCRGSGPSSSKSQSSVRFLQKVFIDETCYM